MSRPYTEDQLSSQLIEERTWRIREISDLRSAVMRADALSRKVLLRALIAICYAHWEGYVRFSAKKYLEHVALRKFSYAELDRQFVRNHFLPKLASLSSSRGSLAERCAVVDNILNSSGIQFSKVNAEIVSTRSNLSFDVFSDICLVCGIAIDKYLDRQAFVDVILLARRNAIAHGEDTFVGIEELGSIVDNTIGIMRDVGDDLENHVYLKRYLAA